MQLAKEDPVFRAASTGKRAGLVFLSRDEADQELREYKAQIQNLRQEVNTTKSVIMQKDEEIAALKQQGSVPNTIISFADVLTLSRFNREGAPI